MEDAAIIDLYWSRAETAIQETSHKYGRYCNSIAVRIVNSQEDAEECVNDAYWGAWDAMPPARPSKLAVFLGKITRNIALTRFYYNTAKKRNKDFTLLLSELEDCLSSTGTVEIEMDERELAGAITAFLREVDEENRNIFLLRYWYAQSIADISKRFAWSESKVKSMLFRTRNLLRKYFEKEGIDI